MWEFKITRALGNTNMQGVKDTINRKVHHVAGLVLEIAQYVLKSYR
jgi:hypothetical protein